MFYSITIRLCPLTFAKTKIILVVFSRINVRANTLIIQNNNNLDSAKGMWFSNAHYYSQTANVPISEHLVHVNVTQLALASHLLRRTINRLVRKLVNELRTKTFASAQTLHPCVFCASWENTLHKFKLPKHSASLLAP